MQVVILAAGEGSRLAPLTSYIPKPLLPIRGKPLLNHIVDALVDDDIGDILVVCHDAFRDQFVHHLAAEMARNRVHLHSFPKAAGTSGELLRLQNELNDEFLVYYADIWTQFRVGEAIKWWTRVNLPGLSSLMIPRPREAIAGLVASRKLKVDKGVVDIGMMDEVLMLREKPELLVPNLMGIGIYLKRILKYAQPGEDLHGDTLPKAIGAGEKVLALVTDETYEDLGTLRAYKEAQGR